jgi:energy-coupling factor transporter ATP-binding protein EcfA2
MKLKSAQVTNFRSAEDTGSFLLDPVTCLVGKNEAGKSAVLMALASLNPHPSTPIALQKERDYPRRYLTKYQERHEGAEAVAVSTVWTLDEADVAPVSAEFGEQAFTSREVEIIRRYDAAKPEWKLSINSAGAVDQPVVLAKIEALLTPRLPMFLYFSNYDRMEGAVQVEYLINLKANNQLNNDKHRGRKLFAEFFDYAGAPIEKIKDLTTFETFNANLQAASINITDQILEYWTQNPDLEVRVALDQGRSGDPPPFDSGTVARARIYNKLHRVDTPFSERSAGFVWFFSFLVKFAQAQALGHQTILLLDEPGLTLHGRAQADLLRYFHEKLMPKHQVIYSTHSPFMIDASNLLSARIVEDEIETKENRRVSHGTKVRPDILTRDPDTLFPLQGALGYDLTQSLFVGKHNLLVEGPSDILYLQALSDALTRKGRVGLDGRWTLCPTGGIGNINAFVSLFGGANKLDVAVLADNTKEDRKKIEALRQNAILKAGRVYTAAEFTGKTEADVEDLFDPDLFVRIVNAAYSLAALHALTVEKLSAAATTERQVKKAEAAFNVMPEGIPVYDHFTPAAWLVRNVSVLEDAGADASLDRAEALFKTFNQLLPTQ